MVKLVNKDKTIDLRFVGKDKESIKRAKNIAQKLIETDTGFNLFKDLSKQGFKIGVAEGIDSVGLASENKRWVLLNPKYSDDLLVGVLAHEARHVQQFAMKSHAEITRHDMKTIIMSDRANEADANVYFAKVAYELEQKGEPETFKWLEKAMPHVAKPFKETAQKYGGDSDKAATEAFKGWYDDIELKTSYEKSYIINRFKELGSNLSRCHFDNSKKPEKVIADVCKKEIRGKNNYFTDNPKTKTVKDIIDQRIKNASR